MPTTECESRAPLTVKYSLWEAPTKELVLELTVIHLLLPLGIKGVSLYSNFQGSQDYILPRNN